jgi:hypothetical protein
MPKGNRFMVWAILGTVFAADALAAPILGRRMTLENRTGAEADRGLSLSGRERSTDVPPIVGDPRNGGAVLEVILDDEGSRQNFDLPETGWTAIPGGFRYSAPEVVGAPVKRIEIRRRPQGRTTFKLLLDGETGLGDLTLVPPNPGTSLTAILEIDSSRERHCVSFGGAAGGSVLANDAQLWSIRKPTAQPECPSPRCCQVGPGLCGWDRAGSCEVNNWTIGAPGSVCDAETGSCVSPPPSPGPCCDVLFSSSPPFCVAGPPTDPFNCSDVGAFTPNAHCTPTGCVPD